MDNFDATVFTSVELVDQAIAELRARRKDLKGTNKELDKEARAAAKEEKTAEAKKVVVDAVLLEGDEITVILKGEEVTASFSKITDSRFVATVDGVKKTFLFDKFLGRV